jgi:hypothetical protein
MKSIEPPQVFVIKWSDGSRNTSLKNDYELEDFILWKQRKYPELTYEIEVMSISEYKLKYN